MDVDGTRLDAHRSELGWLIATQASTVTLDGCDVRVLQAVRGSEITGDLTLHPNTPAVRQMVAESGASIRLGRVDSALESMEVASLAAELRIEELTTPPGASTYVLREQGGTAHVHGRSVEYFDEGTMTLNVGVADAPATANPAAAGDPVPSSELAWEDTAEDGAQQADDTSDRQTTPAPSAQDSAPAPQEDPLAEIMGMTGLATVKEQIEGFTQMVRFNQIRARKGLRTSEISMHSLFLGNPGTGKTTVARMLGRVLHQVGAIRSDTFAEVGRKDLVSDRIGGSAKKTIDVLDSGRGGGVLFIDEAYSLHQEKNNEFAQEAVDALITYMEDHREDVVIIFAGYTDRMQDFLRMNPGLQSRLPNRFDFEDYSVHEIAEIGYRDLLEGDYVVDEDRYRRTVTSLYGRSADRSNGRWVRSLVNRVAMDHHLLELDGTVQRPSEVLADLFAAAGARRIGTWLESELPPFLAQPDAQVDHTLVQLAGVTVLLMLVMPFHNARRNESQVDIQAMGLVEARAASTTWTLLVIAAQFGSIQWSISWLFSTQSDAHYETERQIAKRRAEREISTGATPIILGEMDIPRACQKRTSPVSMSRAERTQSP